MRLDLDGGTTARAAARGLVAAMAMTGMRSVSLGLGLLEQSPPDAIVSQRAHELVSRLSPDRRRVVTELAHWTYGALGGAVFGLLSPDVRRRAWSGPAYGVAAWLLFELVLVPVLAIHHTRRHHVAARAMVALDHVLYGVVVAGRLAPEPAASRGRLRRLTRG